MKIAKHQHYQFDGFVHEVFGDSYFFTSDHDIETGDYFLILTSGIFDFPADVHIIRQGNTYCVSSRKNDELDELQFEAQVNFLLRQIHFNFGLESLEGEIYMPYEEDVN